MAPNAASRRFASAGLPGFALAASLLFSGCNSSYRTYIMAGESMSPLLKPGDRILVDQSDVARSNLNDGDVVAMRHGEATVVKRIVAMPGETISGSQRKVFRNGKQLD